MPVATADHLLALTRKLLESIVAADWKTYTSLVAYDITCFEPEARGHLVEGLPFHEFYFKLGGSGTQATVVPTTTIASPNVRLLGEDAAVVAYTRLVQKLDDAGRPITSLCEETRVWQRIEGAWKHVHFHRSLPG
jgi:calcium/calmodulin-dependent protein kinase (CaM kinase) II